jgi:hypothetical protein
MAQEEVLLREHIENRSGFDPSWQRFIPAVKRRNYQIVNRPLTGDQPKNLVRIYRYGEGRRSNPDTWPTYIAKFGMKWYPMESVTEFLINRIGEEWGMRMAESELLLLNGQVRFLSRYFLNAATDRLVHGAEIYSRHLNDAAFVKHVEAEKLEGRMFSYQFACEAIGATFPNEAEQLVEDFTRMLVFDAFIGAMDRHFYNWGAVVDVTGRKPAVYAPIYDTARGLFWNQREQRLHQACINASDKKQFVVKYCKLSKPKIGMEGVDDLNHYQFVEHLLKCFPKYAVICSELISEQNLGKAIALLKSEFVGLMSPVRIGLIENCLEERFTQLRKVL